MTPFWALVTAIYTGSCLRGAYTSWRLFLRNLGSYRETVRDLRDAGADDADLAVLRDELNLARTKLAWRAARFVIAAAGAVLGAGAFFPDFTRSAVYGTLFIGVFLGVEVLLTFLNEREYQLLGLGKALPAIARRIRKAVTRQEVTP